MGWTRPRSGRRGEVRYQGLYRDMHGTRHSVGTFKTERAARRAAERAENDLLALRVTSARAGKQKLRDYVELQWFPNHLIELTTRETYASRLKLYILPELGDKKLAFITRADIRAWISKLQEEPYNASPATIQKCKVIVDAIYTTALDDGLVAVHPSSRIKTPHVATKPQKYITVETYDRIYNAIPYPAMQLLVETDIETGLRWGELAELRTRDIDFTSKVLTVRRTVMEITTLEFQPDGQRFVVKQYPKGKRWRQQRVSDQLIAKIQLHIELNDLGPDDLIFHMPDLPNARRSRPENLPDPHTLGRTEPNAAGSTFWHGTATAYGAGKCRCRHCKDAVATYRAERRAGGKDNPRQRRTVTTDEDGHIIRGWFRNCIWLKAVAAAQPDGHVTTHGLRHAHASWLLRGGADLETVRERLGHASIRTTQRYLHTPPDRDDVALTALAAVRQGVATARAAGGGALPPATSSELAELAQLREAVAKVKQLHEALGLKL